MEPKIRAKLVLDTSEIGRSISGGGGRSSSGIDSKNDQLLKKLVKGQVPISGLATKMLAAVVGSPLGLAGLGVAMMGGIGSAVIGATNALTDSINGVTEEEIAETNQAQVDSLKETLKLQEDIGANTKKTKDAIKTVEGRSENWGYSMDTTNKGQETVTTDLVTIDETLKNIGTKAMEGFDEDVTTLEIKKQISANLRAYRDSIPKSYGGAGETSDSSIESTSSGRSVVQFKQKIMNGGLGAIKYGFS